MATAPITPTLSMVGYEVRSSTAEPLGEVEGIRSSGIRIHHIPNHSGHHGFVPAAAMATVDPALGRISLVAGIDREVIVDAPPPDGSDPDGWRKSEDWWANLLGHMGLFESEGRGSGPFLHHDA